MNLSTQHAWIVTGSLAAVFALAYLFYFGPQFSQAAQLRATAQIQAQKIEGEWVNSGPDAVPLKTVDDAIAQRESQAFDDVNQVFNAPVAYQRAKAGENPSTYFFNLLDHLKKNPAVKGLLKDAKLTGDWVDDAKYPVELKLRALAMVDRVARAAGSCDLLEVTEIKQSSIQEISPESERAADTNGGATTRGGMRPHMAGDAPATGAAPAATAGTDIRLVRVVMTAKFRGAEGNLIKFLSTIQTPSPDMSELTMVYLNHCVLSSNDKTLGSLDCEMIFSAIFPLKGDDLKMVLANPSQTVLK